MRPRIAIPFAIVLVLGAASRSALAADEVAPPEVAAQGWLALVDQSRLADAWKAGGDLLRKDTTEPEWTEGMQRLREKYGAAESRQIVSRDYHRQLAGAPDGTYFTMRYRTHFSSAGDQLELVTLTAAPGGYRVIGYGIKQ